MKIRTRIKYLEGYLPPRCRKMRYTEQEEYVDALLKEVGINQLKLAFEDNSFEGRGKIYFFKNKLWTPVQMNAICSWQEKEGIKTSLDYLKWVNCNSSKYFYLDRRDVGKDDVIKIVKEDMKNYLLVDGILYERINEPVYAIYTFGLGHNHGGTGLFCMYPDKINLSDNCFSALDGEKAVEYAKHTAITRGDTDDVDRFEPFIVCHMPEIVKARKR